MEIIVKVLQTLGIIQGMNPNVRSKKVHVEHELPHFEALNLEVNMTKWIDPIVQAFKSKKL
jgi:hypothetical protein